MIAIDTKKIIEMFQKRDEQVLEVTIRLYGAQCKAVARDILNSDEDAEECLNDALWTVWNAIPPAQPENFYAYLLKITRNIALNQYKAKQRTKRGSGQIAATLDELSEVLPASDNVEKQIEQRELLAAINAFLHTLPQVQSDLFIRRYWRFSSFAALADEFGLTENHVKVILTRLRKRLKQYLRKEGLL